MGFNASKTGLLRTVLTFLIDFVGFMTMWWLLMPYESTSSIWVYTLFFISLAVVFHSSDWVACRILKLLNFEEIKEILVPPETKSVTMDKRRAD